MADDVTKQISSLDTRMSRRFAALDKKFDEQFKGVDGRFESIDGQFKAVRREFGGVRQEVGSIRQEGRETRVLLEDVQQRVQALGEGFTGMTGRVDRMEHSLTAEIRATQATYTPLTTHRTLDRRVATLEKTRRKD